MVVGKQAVRQRLRIHVGSRVGIADKGAVLQFIIRASACEIDEITLCSVANKRIPMTAVRFGCVHQRQICHDITDYRIKNRATLRHRISAFGVTPSNKATLDYTTPIGNCRRTRLIRAVKEVTVVKLSRCLNANGSIVVDMAFAVTVDELKASVTLKKGKKSYCKVVLK